MNTSFNLQEPMVETPADALATFGKLGLRHLVLDDILVVKDTAE